MRRALGALVVALALVGAGPAQADDSIDEDDCSGPPFEGNACWAGSELAAGPATQDETGSISVSGSFNRIPTRTIRVELRATPSAGLPGCPVNDIGYLDDTPPPDEGFSQDYEFAGTFDVPCNGRYLVQAVAITVDDAPDPIGPTPSPRPHDEAVLDRTVAVIVPPPDVTGVQAVEGTARAVTVTWAEVAPKPADHRGYVVMRSASDGSVEHFNVPSTAGTSFVDENPPPAGGDTKYQVFARRPGATADSEVRSIRPGTGVVALSAAPPTTGGATPGTGGSGGTTGSGSGSVRPGRPSPSAGPSIRIPRVGTPSRNFFPALLAPPDPGFSEELPFDVTEPGDAVDDELASEPLEALPGRGLAIPIATGLVLAVWALHLRFLARASRPEYGESIEILVD